MMARGREAGMRSKSIVNIIQPSNDSFNFIGLVAQR